MQADSSQNIIGTAWDRTQAGVYRTTPGGQLIYGNAALLVMFGYDSMGAFYSTPVSGHYVHPGRRRELYEKALRQGGYYYERVRFKRQNGQEFTGLDSCTVVRDQHGSVLHFEGSITPLPDIGLDADDPALRLEREAPSAAPAPAAGSSETETEHAGGETGPEEAPHREAERADVRRVPEGLLVENVSDIVTILDADGTIRYESPAIERVLGYAQDELVGASAFAYVHPDDRDHIRARFREARDTGIPLIQVEGRFRHANGHWVYLDMLGRNLLDDQELNGFLVTSRDITKRKEAEQTLQRGLRRTEVLHRIGKELLSSTSVAVDELSTIALTYVEELVPHTASYVLVFDVADEAANVIAARPSSQSARLAGNDQQVEPSLPLSAFTTTAASEQQTLSYTPSLDEVDTSGPWLRHLYAQGVRSLLEVPLVVDGEAIGLLSIGTAEHDAYSREHRAIAREVADMLGLAFRQAGYERQLVEAKEAAEEANRIKSAFLANMSHEIRTPLTSVIGFSEIISDEMEGPPSDMAKLIRRSSQRLLDTLDSVLSLSRLEAGAVHLKPEEVNVVEEVAGTMDIFRSRADDAGVTLELEAASATVQAVADVAALHRIISNLISNALKFTDAGGRITARVERDADIVRIEVEDTGIGMEDVFLEHLFEPFVQEGTGKQRGHPGTGLGLAVTHRLVQYMDGEISVQSQKGVGTRFTIHLPIDWQREHVGETIDVSVNYGSERY